MGETLFDRACRNLKVGITNIKFSSDDEFYVNAAGYFFQQSVELAMKYVLLMNGITYPFEHDLYKLYTLIPEDDKKLFDPVCMYLNEITSFESKTRYITDFFLDYNILIRFVPLIKKALLNVSNEYDNPIEKLKRTMLQE